jgi:hypothetical protein
MTDSDLRFPDDAPDSAVAGALRPLLAPPHDDYWGALERAIMARIAEERGAWWSALGDWARPAMLAAAVALIAATVLLSRSSSADAAIAYGAVSEEQYPVIESSMTATANDRAATVYMLLDH